MRVLADTSVWVGLFRPGRDPGAEHLLELAERGELVACGPVLAELLVGTPAEDREAIRSTVGSLPWVDLDQAAWWAAGVAGRELRRRGTSVPLVDLAIAAAAAHEGVEVWTRDRDFERIAEVLPGLVLHRPPEP
ncbi:MAG TPA: PIN domain-containing protein [Actinomycetota bacterium]|nr:PIN domain-containing protein [Actinomycetota bacterium]